MFQDKSSNSKEKLELLKFFFFYAIDLEDDDDALRLDSENNAKKSKHATKEAADMELEYERKRLFMLVKHKRDMALQEVENMKLINQAKSEARKKEMQEIKDMAVAEASAMSVLQSQAKVAIEEKAEIWLEMLQDVHARAVSLNMPTQNIIEFFKHMEGMQDKEVQEAKKQNALHFLKLEKFQKYQEASEAMGLSVEAIRQIIED